MPINPKQLIGLIKNGNPNQNEILKRYTIALKTVKFQQVILLLHNQKEFI